MATAYSTQGNNFEVTVESSLGTAAGTTYKWRLEDAPTIPTESRQVEQQGNRHRLATRWGDPPINYEAAQESALSLSMFPRRGSGTNQAPLMTLLESGGWTLEDSAVDSQTAGAPAVGDFDAAADLFGGADTYNAAVLVETVAGTTWYPTLLMEYDDDPDRQCTPAMDLPAIAAVGGDILRMKTAHVSAAAVPSNKTLTCEFTSRGKEGVSNYTQVKMAGCALADLGEITINRDSTVKFNPTLHVADVSIVDSLMDKEATNDYQSGTESLTTYSVPPCRVESSLFRFEFAPGGYLATGGITNANLEFISAVVRPNITTVPIPGVGSSSCLNGIQGYMQRVARPECEITILCDEDYYSSTAYGFEQSTASTRVPSHLGFVWGISDMDAADPAGTALGIWMPRAELIKSPTMEMFGDHSVLMTLTFGATAPEFTQDSGGISNGDPNASPIVIAMYQGS